jgi:hypothetical protein
VGGNTQSTASLPTLNCLANWAPGVGGDRIANANAPHEENRIFADRVVSSGLSDGDPLVFLTPRFALRQCQKISIRFVATLLRHEEVLILAANDTFEPRAFASTAQSISSRDYANALLLQNSSGWSSRSIGSIIWPRHSKCRRRSASGLSLL